MSRTFAFVGQDVPAREPPPQRARALEYIRLELSAGQGFPAPEKIAAYMGWKNPKSGVDVCHGLVIDKQLVRVPFHSNRDGRRRFKFALPPP